ncbi:MAG: LysM peptidoglycan-binding domain-containing protein [Syntrophales bacterium]
MLRTTICVMLIILMIGCAGRSGSRQPGEGYGAMPSASGASDPVKTIDNPGIREQGRSSSSGLPAIGDPAVPKQPPPAVRELPEATKEITVQSIVEPAPQKKNEFPSVEQRTVSVKEQSPNQVSASPKKTDASRPNAKHAQLSKPQRQEGNGESLEDTERDMMEEALVLLNESHRHWVKGDLENALEMLDQAYALLLDTNGSPDTARQKDDLRLMISKRILSIYNSLQTAAKGKRSEIPIITNADVEKEIRQFQTVERDFFISSYQRSALYLPLILKQLRKAGLPEELAWLPLVESGFKISALSSARALGLWQFIPSTGYKYGLNRDDWVDERMDVEKSTRAAIDYLKELHTMFGDWLTVLAAYNCGEGRVMRTIASQHINYLDRFWDLYQRLPYETARYVPRFLATLIVIRDPQKYGIDLGTPKPDALSYEIVEVKKSMRLHDIAQKLDTSEEILHILNAELRHRITPDRPYILKVPATLAGRLADVLDEIPEAERPRASSSQRAIIRHKVRAGESLASIAGKYNVSVATLAKYNRLSKRHRPVAGQRLNVPIQVAKSAGAAAKTKTTAAGKGVLRHKVQKGDTLTALAAKYDTTVAEIKTTNQLSADALKIGQVLSIGAHSEPAEQRARKAGAQKGGAKEKAADKSHAVKEPDAKKAKKYTVKKGDSLNKIARENNMSLDRLLELNNLARKHTIQPGQIILVQ